MPRRRQSPLPENVPLTSSTPSKLPKKQETLFQEVLQLLEAKKIAFVVSGAFALAEHTGICRDTKDLDVFLPADEASRALEFLVAEGFECEVKDPIWLAKAHRDGYFVDLITGMSNAVIVVDSSWIARSRRCTILGVKTRLLAPEELIASKLFVTRRERFDGADIVHVIHGTNGKLDWNRILSHAGEHWEIVLWALVLFHYVYPAHSDYVPRWVWDDLLSRFRNAVAQPDIETRFRGSLIDENMFAIDVHEWGMADILGEERARRTHKIPQNGNCPTQSCPTPDPSHLV